MWDRLWNSRKRWAAPSPSSASREQSRAAGEPITLPRPTSAEEDGGGLVRTYEFPSGLAFSLFSVHPDVKSGNQVVPASQWFECFFAGPHAEELQTRLEQEQVLWQIASARWADTSEAGYEFYGVRRLLKVQAREAGAMLRVIGGLKWVAAE